MLYLIHGCDTDYHIVSYTDGTGYLCHDEFIACEMGF